MHVASSASLAIGARRRRRLSSRAMRPARARHRSWSSLHGVPGCRLRWNGVCGNDCATRRRHPGGGRDPCTRRRPRRSRSAHAAGDAC